jgi:hypothetical protein
MKTAAVATVLLATAASVSAFAPSAAFTRQASPLFAEATATEKTVKVKNELFLDENFEGVNIVRLMGLQKMKKKARRNKRKLNEKIRAGTVVKDESTGEWIAK